MGGCTLTASLAHKARTTPTARPFQLSHLLSAAHLFQFAAIHTWTLKISFQTGTLPPLTEGREQEGGNTKWGENRRVDCLWLFSSLLPRMRQRIKRRTSRQIPSSRETFGWWCCESGKNPGGRNGIGRSGAGRRALTAAAALRRSLHQRAWEQRTTRTQPPMLPSAPGARVPCRLSLSGTPQCLQRPSFHPLLEAPACGATSMEGEGAPGVLRVLWPEALLLHLHGRDPWDPGWAYRTLSSCTCASRVN